MTEPSLLRLRNADSVVDVFPALGGTLTRYQYRGVPILRPSDGIPAIARLASCYPLVPFSNRIAGGQLAFGGTAHPIARTVDYEPLPMHGVAWQRAWEVMDSSDSHAVLEQTYLPPPQSAPWPFAFHARQAITLRSDGLHLTLSLRNTDRHAQPVGLGWHPYFPRTPETRVWLDVREMWECDAAHLPARLVPAPAALADGIRADDTDYDNPFRGFGGHARIAWPERGMAVTLRADPALTHAVLFTPPGKPHLAVEPVTHVTDAFNRYTVAGGGVEPTVDEATGTVVLAPGGILAVSLSLHPEALP